MPANFKTIAEQFRQAARSDDIVGPFLVADAAVAAAQAVKRHLDVLPLDIDVRWPTPGGPRRDTAAEQSAYQLCWNAVCRNACQNHPQELPLDPWAVRWHGKSNDDFVTGTIDPKDWKRRAWHYAAVCDWLAEASEAVVPTPPPVEPTVERANDRRNKWLYPLFHKKEHGALVPHKAIVARLKKKCDSTGWSFTKDIPSLKRDVDTWAKRNGKPPIPKRSQGRRSSGSKK